MSTMWSVPIGPAIGIPIGAIAGTSSSGAAHSFDYLFVDTASMPPS